MGGASRPERQMIAFREALDFYRFRNLGFMGSPFTWCNNQFNGVVTWILLDQGVATPAWTQVFLTVRVHHIPGSLSDHSPLWICSDNENARFYRRRRHFRFEVAWMKDEGCARVIKSVWEGHETGSPMNTLVNKVEACSAQHKSWSRMSFGNIRRLLGKKQKELVQAKARSIAGHSHDQVRLLHEEVHDLMVKEECM